RTGLRRVGSRVEQAHELRRAEAALHRRAGCARRAAARPESRRDGLARVTMLVVAFLVVVLVRGVEVVKARGLLLVGVGADVVRVVARRGAAVAGIDRRELHQAVVLSGEAQARTEDRRIAAGE